MDLLQFSSAGSIDFTAFDVVETHSAKKIWLGALCVDRAFSFMLLQSPVRLTDDSSGEWFWIVVLQISRKAASASPTGLHGTFPPLLGLA